MLKLYFYFLQSVLRIHTFGEKDKSESFGDQAKATIYLSCLLLFCVIVEIALKNCQN